MEKYFYKNKMNGYRIMSTIEEANKMSYDQKIQNYCISKSTQSKTILRQLNNY